VRLLIRSDYEPAVDVERFPRENIHFPEAKSNVYGAWAWKCDIADKVPLKERGILDGKTIALKDNISVQGVPMLMGTDFVKGYIPVQTLNLPSRLEYAEIVLRPLMPRW